MVKRQAKRTGNQRVSVTLSELLQLSRDAEQLSLSALSPKTTQAGPHLSRLLGRGMEFAESRRYHSGDDSRNIDWRVTARTGKAHTKLFTDEKERQVLLCVDMRSPMFFATKGVFKSVQAALMGGCVAWNAVKSGNRLGGLIFDDLNHFEFRPALGKRGILPFLHQLAESSKIKSKEGSNPFVATLHHAIAAINRLATPGSLIFIISDFRQLSVPDRDLLIQLARHSDIYLCFIYDSLEVALPKNGFFPVTDGQTELQLNTFDKKNLGNYQQQFIERRNAVASMGQQRHIHFMECSTQDDCLNQVFKKL